MLRNTSLVTAACGTAALVLWVAGAAATPPGDVASFSDTTIASTRVVTQLGTNDEGTVLTKTTIDGSFGNLAGTLGSLTGPFHTTVLSARHTNGITDTSGVDYCLACVDLAGHSGEIANHLIGVTGGTTHSVTGPGTAGLSDTRGTFTFVRIGTQLTDQGFLATSPPCLTGTHDGPLTAGAGESLCLGPGATVTGPVTVSDGGTLHARGASISGPVRVSDASAVAICGTEIEGPLSVSGSVGPALIGEPASGDCAGNEFDGPVRLTGNTTGLDFSGNTVSGRLVATDNVGGFMFGEFAPNAVSGPVTASGNV